MYALHVKAFLFNEFRHFDIFFSSKMCDFLIKNHKKHNICVYYEYKNIFYHYIL